MPVSQGVHPFSLPRVDTADREKEKGDEGQSRQDSPCPLRLSIRCAGC